MELVLPEELTIERAAAVKALLQDALGTDAREPLALRAGAVRAVDAAGLQLLCAARRTAVAQGRALSLSRVTEPLARALAQAGLGRARDDAWLVEGRTDG